jgi:hypothetical protein
MKKIIALILILGLFLAPTTPAFALTARTPVINASASALVPGLGQILNNEQATWTGRLKIATMLGVELAAILATPALARSGFPQVMIGVGMFVVNHVWSATDAYRGALEEPEVNMAGTYSR